MAGVISHVHAFGLGSDQDWGGACHGVINLKAEGSAGAQPEQDES